jgi:Flp pilus assembly protein TadD
MLGRHEEARTVFAEQVRSYPEDLGAWRDLAIASIEMGDLDRARSAADRLLELASKDSRGLTLRGLVAERAGDLDGAVRWYQSAVGADPKDADAAAALGLALRKIGRCEEADASLRRALELDPGFTLVANALEASDE